MITFFNVLADVVFVAVVGLAVAMGGRYERALAGVLVLSWAATQAAQRLFQDYLPLAAFLTLDLALMAAYGWLLWRHRPTWLVVAALAHLLAMGLVVLQAVRPPPSIWIFFHTSAVLGYVQLFCLAFAVLRGRFGPPFRPRPATGGAR